MKILSRAALILGPLAILLLLAGCLGSPPIVNHDGRTAEMSPSWGVEAEGGANYFSWAHNDSVRNALYFTGGAFTGQNVGPIALEEGVLITGYQGFLAGLSAGVGLSFPRIALRASYFPTWAPSTGSTFLHGWWQSSLLTGVRIPLVGLGISGGGIASPWGLGPTLLADWRIASVAIRGQGSFTFKAPWAPSHVNGQMLTLSLFASHYSGH